MKKMRAVLAAVAVAVLAVMLCACSPQGASEAPQGSAEDAAQREQPAQPEAQEQVTDDQGYSMRDYTGYPELDEVLNSIVLETEQTSQELRMELDALLAACDGSYEGYLANKQQLADWYAKAGTASADLYASIQAQTESYHRLLFDGAQYREYKVWNDVLSESYDVWNDALSDHYDAWDGMLKDVYHECDSMIGEAIDTASYDEYQQSWSEMYDQYQDAWSDLYDQYQDAWSELYDSYQDAWDELYSRR